MKLGMLHILKAMFGAGPDGKLNAHPVYRHDTNNPGHGAPRFNQRKARKRARRVNRLVVR